MQHNAACTDTLATVDEFNPFSGPHRSFVVTGGTGFIGKNLVNLLLDAGHSVAVVSRDPIRAARLFAHRAKCVADFTQLPSDNIYEVIINLAGASIAGGRWSNSQKIKLLESRPQVTRALIEWSAQLTQRPALLINASAIGFYGSRRADEILTESSNPGREFMADLCREWEALAQTIEAQHIRLVILRLGVVFGHGGAMPLQTLPFKLFVGGRIGDGMQFINWIHIDDVMAIMAEAIGNESMRGIFNAVAPERISQYKFAQSVGHVLRRPVWTRVPACVLKFAAGEMSQLFLAQQNVVPQKLLSMDFRFRFPTMDAALRDLL